MPSETLKSTADSLVGHCRAGTTKEGLKELYDPNAVSVEAAPMPGADSPETKGVKGIEGKHDWWAPPAAPAAAPVGAAPGAAVEAVADAALLKSPPRPPACCPSAPPPPEPSPWPWP